MNDTLYMPINHFHITESHHYAFIVSSFEIKHSVSPINETSDLTYVNFCDNLDLILFLGGIYFRKKAVIGHFFTSYPLIRIWFSCFSMIIFSSFYFYEIENILNVGRLRPGHFF